MASEPVPLVPDSSTLADEVHTLEAPKATFGITRNSPNTEKRQLTPVRYLARVQGTQGIRVIINETPCLPVKLRLLSESRHGVSLTCSSLDAASIKVVLENDGRTLNLVHEGVLLVRLRPGDTWR